MLLLIVTTKFEINNVTTYYVGTFKIENNESYFDDHSLCIITVYLVLYPHFLLLYLFILCNYDLDHKICIPFLYHSN